MHWHDNIDMIAMIGVWLLVIVGAAIGLRYAFSVQRPPEESPETILKRRYANGELDDAEYEHRLAELRK